MRLHVFVVGALVGELFAALFTLCQNGAGVNPLVSGYTVRLCKRLTTNLAPVRPEASMHSVDMSRTVASLGERSVTYVTAVRPLTGVRSHVCR